jgi:hypothetical protein
MSIRLRCLIVVSFILASPWATGSTGETVMAQSPELCPAPPAGLTQAEMEPGTVRLLAGVYTVEIASSQDLDEEMASSPEASPHESSDDGIEEEEEPTAVTLKWGRICIEANTTISDAGAPVTYPQLYVINIEDGQLSVSVTPKPGGSATIYESNVPTEVTAGTHTLTGDPGDVIVIRNVEAIFQNPSTTDTTTLFATQQTDPFAGPNCTHNCWLPSCVLLDPMTTAGCGTEKDAVLSER